MKLPVIRHLVKFINNNDQDFIEEAVEVLNVIAGARGIKEEELDVIGELMSNMEGALEVDKLIKKGMTEREALNSFMKRVTNIGND